MYNLYLFLLGVTLFAGTTNSQYRANSDPHVNAQEDSSLYDVFENPGFPREYENFDINLFQKMVNSKTTNMIVSPLSVKYALSILYEAAEGQTKVELQHLVSPTMNNTENTAKMVAIREFLKTPPTLEYILEFGNRLFVDGSIAPEQKFGAILENSYNTKVSKIDVNKPSQTADEANKWVKQVTRGNIDRIVSEDDLRDTVILLVNTLYFNGTWENMFHTNETKPGAFYLSGAKSISVPMMKQTEKFHFLNSDSFEAKFLKMPYKGDKLSMILVVPNSIQGLQDLVAQLTATKLQKEVSKMMTETVAVTIPKFKFDFETHLVPILKNMGLREVFENTASLPGLARGKGIQTKLAVNDILQKAGIELNEFGSTIYAATAISLVNKFGEDDDGFEEFIADKPFLFFVQNENTEQILFMGTVGDPTKTKAEYVEQKLSDVPAQSGNARTSRYK